MSLYRTHAENTIALKDHYLPKRWETREGTIDDLCCQGWREHFFRLSQIRNTTLILKYNPFARNMLRVATNDHMRLLSFGIR